MRRAPAWDREVWRSYLESKQSFRSDRGIAIISHSTLFSSSPDSFEGDFIKLPLRVEPTSLLQAPRPDSAALPWLIVGEKSRAKSHRNSDAARKLADEGNLNAETARARGKPTSHAHSKTFNPLDLTS